MFDGIFAGWHWVILLLVVLVLFGAKRLPGAAQSLGQSMHIFSRSVKGLHQDDQPGQPGQPGPGFPGDVATPAPPTQPPAIAPVTTAAPALEVTQQQQLADLQRQLNDLQSRTGGAAVTDTAVPQPQHPQQ